MKKVIAGNWKMNHTASDAAGFLQTLRGSDHDHARLVVFPSALAVTTAVSEAQGVEIGVQNIFWEASGAYTGETSAEMAAAVGASLVLIGHSERRHVFGETDGETASKVEATLRAGLEPVVCVGETLEERQAGQLTEVLDRQLSAVAQALGGAPSFMLAYEPVWAIGTGETATPEDASEAHGFLRSRMEELGLPSTNTPILYGGSVKPGNAAGLLFAPDVDGVLVGGASLSPEDFAAIAEACR